MIVISSKNYGQVKIRSVQANRLYQVQKEYKYKSKYDGAVKDSKLEFGTAVLPDSMFTRYMINHGVTIKKNRESLDFVVMKFDYYVDGYSEDGLMEDVERKELKNQKDYASRISAKELRKKYYNEGAEITWQSYDSKTGEPIPELAKTIKYRMLMRSPGKAKEGSCIFIREDLLEVAQKYLTMDLYDKLPEQGAKIVELSAYSTMITAAAKDFVQIPLKNMLIVKDQESSSIIKALCVRTNEQKQCEVVTDDNCKVTNVLWDGEGLIDESLFPGNMEGFIYCRSHFFKSCLFRGNVVDYLKDYYKEKYNTVKVRDMFGRQIKVSNIRVIVTENSIKWLKFKELMGDTPAKAYEYYERIMKKDDYTFSIVKTAHSSKWGDLQRSSYQINNSLPTVDEKILEKIAQPSIDYINRMIKDPAAYVEYLKMDASKKYSVKNVLAALYEHNPEIIHLDFWMRKKSEIIEELKNKRFRTGKLLQHGDNLTFCGNPIALLMQATKQDPLEEGCFSTRPDGIECYTTRFPNGTRLAGFRSPHNSPNNIVHFYNVYPPLLQKYFPKLGNNVIVTNGIGTDLQPRLNSQDYDSDYGYVTDQKEIVKLARKAYKEYPTIINEIPLAGTSSYNKDMNSFAEMDSTISGNQIGIGQSSDIAQLALSYYFDRYADKGEKDIRLEEIFVICSVIAQVCIDGAKRIYDITPSGELKSLKKEIMEYVSDGKIYPQFFYKSKKNKQKDKCKITEDEVRVFKCPMDILSDIINRKVIDTRVEKQYQVARYKYLDYFMEPISDAEKSGHQFKKVKEVVEAYDRTVKDLNKSDENYEWQIDNAFSECMTKIKKWKLKQGTMRALIVYALSSGCKYPSRMMTVLYDYNSELFLNCFKSGKNEQNF